MSSPLWREQNMVRHNHYSRGSNGSVTSVHCTSPVMHIKSSVIYTVGPDLAAPCETINRLHQYENAFKKRLQNYTHNWHPCCILAESRQWVGVKKRRNSHGTACGFYLRKHMLVHIQHTGYESKCPFMRIEKKKHSVFLKYWNRVNILSSLTLILGTIRGNMFRTSAKRFSPLSLCCLFVNRI